MPPLYDILQTPEYKMLHFQELLAFRIEFLGGIHYCTRQYSTVLL